MFSLQTTLAASPIPSLQSSCDKLLEWTEPLLSEQDWLKTKEIVAQFTRPGGEGEKLQYSLENWASNKDVVNWTNDVWMEFYLTGRYPLAINSNVFYFLQSKLDRNDFSQSQIASALIMSVFEFNLLIENETLSIDKQKGQPLCMAQYNNLFSATRTPQKGKDNLAVSSGKKHVVVLCKEHIYKLEIVNEEGSIHSFLAIEEALQQILSITNSGQNIGILTTLHRDEWAGYRTALVDIDKKNKEHLKYIEDAVFALSLDENSPEELVETSQMLLHGDGKDRYFDKSLQFVVFENGKTGVNFEHTGMDGSVMLRMIGHIYDNIDKFPEHQETSSAIIPEQLTFQLDNQLTTSLDKAHKVFSDAVANTQTRLINFTSFGKNQIKEFKVSPDAFVQIALQLAEYKLYGKCTSAYEAIMTRGFLHGRIDVLFTVSMESKAFIENIHNKDCDQQTKIDLLRQAAAKHITRAGECRIGQGIHTHLLGLISRFENEGDALGISALPEIFTDKGYQTLTHNIICTSTTSEYGVELAGYGPAVDDGYGIRYFNRPDSLCFNITSRTENKDNLELMVKYIEESLGEMAELMARD